MSTIQNHIDTRQATSINSNEEEKKIWAILDQVADPEIPVLSIVDLGIVREVKILNPLIPPSGGGGAITITPTYSGCPAMDMITMQIRIALLQNGYSDIKINTVLSPAWTTDWMTDKGKEKLKAYGIAPPVGKSFNQQYLEDIKVECPQCHSTNTRLLSQFGSTSCKALFQCNDCKEPFDYFKCH
jgi:ring-1,2-phenylacetyl-CoA epoxidase subunit PaaD